MQPTVESTIEFITRAHAGQVDKAGLPYYLHPIAVMNRLPANAPQSWKLAALLHDVIEDTPYSRDDLSAMGYDAETLAIVTLLTMDEADTRPYDEKIKALIADSQRLNCIGAIAVKYADMSENADPQRLAALDAAQQEYLTARYKAPLEWLRTALDAALAS